MVNPPLMIISNASKSMFFAFNFDWLIELRHGDVTDTLILNFGDSYETWGDCRGRFEKNQFCLTLKAQDILSPDCRGKKPSSPQIQKEYSDDGLSGYTVSSLKAVRHRYILFVFMVCSVVFFARSPGLVYLGPNCSCSRLHNVGR